MDKKTESQLTKSREPQSQESSQPLFKIICDSREQLPLSFEGLKIRGVPRIETIRRKLDVGDYSIEGQEDSVFIERKSVNDLYGTLFQGRERFEKELERAKNHQHRYLVIESTPFGFASYMEYHRNMMQFNSAFSSLMIWAERYGLKVRWCKTPAGAADYVARLAIKIYSEDAAAIPIGSLLTA